MNVLAPSKIILFSLSLIVLSAAARTPAETITNDQGLSLTIDGASGNYTITAKDPAWTLGGTIGSPLTDLTTAQGKDNIGPYHEIKFNWKAEGRRTSSLHMYNARPLVLFAETFQDAVDHSPTAFPILTKLPEKLLEFRYGETDHLRPESFHLPIDPKDQYGGPFTLFDANANTLILSPASDFMIAQMSGDQKQGLHSGFNKSLQSIPAGYTHQTLLAIDKGINHSWDTWGQALTDLYGKKRPQNDADIGLKYLGYWTDNGSYYYYNYDIEKGYAGTLLAVKSHLDQVHVPIHYMQLDSWWYPKTFTSFETKASGKSKAKDPRIPAGEWNRYGGLLEYAPSPDLFPNGLEDFHKKLGLPFVTHSRWIDPESPYHKDYKIAGVASIDPKWWEKITSDISSWGVITYEQDWLNWIYLKSPELNSTTWAGEAFMDDMAAACAAHDLTMQLCMVMPRYLLQAGAKYPNLTTVRVSGDRLDRGKWRQFLYGSQLASALGVWPWTDVYHSNETANILISTLSAGMVGISDKIGDENLENIFRSVRHDGVIVKPDVPMTPIDATYIAEGQDKHPPLICATHTSNESSTAYYIFAFEEKQPAADSKDQPKTWAFTPSSIGLNQPAISYDFFTGKSQLIDPAKELSESFNKQGWSYRILAPVGPSGMAFIGDTGMFITRGKNRIASISEKPGEIQTTVRLSPTETTVTLALYAPSKPDVEIKNGSSTVQYDATTKIAHATITVNPDAPATEISGDRVIDLPITFHLPTH